jgi:hypothetical protein
MTTFLVPKNNAYSTMASGIDDNDLALTVATGEGARFPTTFPFHITIDSEILSCTDRTADVLTVTRGAESTTPAAHLTAATVRLNITAEAISELGTAINLRLLISEIDDSPADGVTTAPISSNWAYDHVAAADPHTGYLLESLYDADSIVAATSNDTPSKIDLAEQTLVGRLTGGHPAAITIGIGDNNIVQVDGTLEDNDFAYATANGIEGKTAAESLTLLLAATMAESDTLKLASKSSLHIPTLATTLTDGHWEGITVAGVVGTAAGQILGDLCYFNPATNEWLLTDADAVATALGTLGICLVAGAENDASTYLLWGRVRADAAFPTFTALTTLYMSGTPGDITETAPTGSSGIIRVLGYSVNANEIFFQPDTGYVTLKA